MKSIIGKTFVFIAFVLFLFACGIRKNNAKDDPVEVQDSVAIQKQLERTIDRKLIIPRDSIEKLRNK